MTTLEGIKTIADFLGTTPKRLKHYARNGAPVRVSGKGRTARYIADKDALTKWLRCERPAKA